MPIFFPSKVSLSLCQYFPRVKCHCHCASILLELSHCHCASFHDNRAFCLTVKNLFTEFHENPTNGSFASTGLRTNGRTWCDIIATWGFLLFFVKKCNNWIMSRVKVSEVERRAFCNRIYNVFVALKTTERRFRFQGTFFICFGLPGLVPWRHCQPVPVRPRLQYSS